MIKLSQPKNLQSGSIIWWTDFDVEGKEKELNRLEKETQTKNFWDDNVKAGETNQRINTIKNEIASLEEFQKEINDLKELEGLTGETLTDDIEKRKQDLERKIKKEEIKTFFADEYDKNNAILQIFSGAGGVDAQDWATMILRMFERYCATKNFDVKVLHQAFGEGGGPEGRIGIKSATLEVNGPYAYGFLKNETGVHRLVRISPFSSQKLRHTSFVLVEVLPELGKGEEKEIEIKPEDLKVDTFKSSGPGGQYVNKRESAIRITHIPTNIVVSSQSERLQGANRENAMKILYAKIYQLKKEQKKQKMSEIKGGRVSASWGNQIRSYVLHPYKMVKDLRTDVETSDVNKVLDGDLDEFIEAEIKIVSND